jgi:hypothetical protein
MTVWLIGHSALAQTLERAPYAALASRIQVRVHLKAVVERDRFALLVAHALKSILAPPAGQAFLKKLFQMAI